MAKIFSFLTIHSLNDNNVSSNNPVGELSTHAISYSLDILKYNTPNTKLHNFWNEDATVPEATGLDANSAIVAARFNNITADVVGGGAMVDKMIGMLGANISGVSVGADVLDPIDNKEYPSWVAFTYTDGTEYYTYKIWLANAIFEVEYPRATYDVVFPLDNPQLMYTDFATAQLAVASSSMASMLAKVNQLGHCITGSESIALTVFKLNDIGQSFPIDVVVTWNGGPSASNISDLLGAIGDALVDGGVNDIDDWIIVIPGLSPVNKFFIVPEWGNPAITYLNLGAIYSPTTDLARFETIRTTYFPDILPANDVLNYLNYSVAIFKSVGFFALPNKGNLDGRLTFSEKHPTYFAVPVNDSNVNPMTPETRAFTIKLDQMLALAETWTVGDVLTTGIILEIRSGKNYLTTRVGDVEMSVLTKYSVINP